MSSEGQVITAAMMVCTALHPLFIQFFHIRCINLSNQPWLHIPNIYCVIADLLILLAPAKRLFIILQFRRIQIFSFGHSLKQTAYYCWTALATVLLGPAEAIEAALPVPG